MLVYHIMLTQDHEIHPWLQVIDTNLLPSEMFIPDHYSVGVIYYQLPTLYSIY